MGLLDNYNDDEKSAGLLQFGLSMLGNSGPSDTKRSFGQIFANGANAGLGTMAQMKKQKADEEREKQMQEMRVMQLQEMRQQMATRDTALSQQNAILGAARQAMQSPEQQAASLPGGPSVANAARIPQMQGGFDQDAFIQQVMGIDPLKGLALQKDMAKTKPEFDTTPRVGTDETTGKPFTYVLDKAGNKKRLDGVLPREKMETLNLGGKEVAFNPYALQAGHEFMRTQSPDSVASNGIARERLSFDKGQVGKPTFNAEAGGFISPPSAANPNGGITPLAGFARPEKPLTEAQGKASTFALRMTEADKSLNELYKNGVTNSGGIKRFAEGTGNLIGLGTDSFGGALSNLAGTATNWTQSGGQQQVEQSKRDFINAILRQESGAAIGKNEFESADKQYFPQAGDDDNTIAQKAQNRQLAIQGMKMQAGAGAAKIDAFSPKKNSGGWSIQRAE